MDFFQDEKRAREEFLAEYRDDGRMYFWPLEEAFAAAQMIFDPHIERASPID